MLDNLHFPYSSVEKYNAQTLQISFYNAKGGPTDPRSIIDSFENISQMSGADIFEGSKLYCVKEGVLKICTFSPSNHGISGANFTGADCVWKDIILDGCELESIWEQVGEGWTPEKYDRLQELFDNLDKTWKLGISDTNILWGFIDLNGLHESEEVKEASDYSAYLEISEENRDKIFDMIDDTQIKDFFQQTVSGTPIIDRGVGAVRIVEGVRSRFYPSTHISNPTDVKLFYGSTRLTKLTKFTVDLTADVDWDKVRGHRFVVLVPSSKGFKFTAKATDTKLGVIEDFIINVGNKTIEGIDYDIYVSKYPLSKCEGRDFPSTKIEFSKS